MASDGLPAELNASPPLTTPRPGISCQPEEMGRAGKAGQTNQDGQQGRAGGDLVPGDPAPLHSSCGTDDGDGALVDEVRLLMASIMRRQREAHVDPTSAGAALDSSAVPARLGGAGVPTAGGSAGRWGGSVHADGVAVDGVDVDGVAVDGVAVDGVAVDGGDAADGSAGGRAGVAERPTLGEIGEIGEVGDIGEADGLTGEGGWVSDEGEWVRNLRNLLMQPWTPVPALGLSPAAAPATAELMPTPAPTPAGLDEQASPSGLESGVLACLQTDPSGAAAAAQCVAQCVAGGGVMLAGGQGGEAVSPGRVVLPSPSDSQIEPMTRKHRKGLMHFVRRGLRRVLRRRGGTGGRQHPSISGEHV